MKSLLRGWALLLFVAAATMLPDAGRAGPPVSFRDSYENLSLLQLEGGRCGRPYEIQGLAPADTGAYPVFVYLRGTVEFFPTPASVAAVEAMARRGFVAARLDYPNETFGGCRTLQERARCAFDGARSGSAIGALCGRPEADCSKGVVAAGFSQGSILSLLAHDYDTRVRAVHGMGTGVRYMVYDLRACTAEGNRSLPADRHRAVTGESDDFLGARRDRVRNQLEQLTGRRCGDTAVECLNSAGSGWRIVPGDELGDGRADHCYMNEGDLFQCLWTDLDANWREGTGSWALQPGLDWLVRTLEADLSDDRLEPNDTRGEAAVLVEGTYRFLQARDDDYYALELAAGDTLIVSLDSPRADVRLGLKLYDPDRRRPRVSARMTPGGTTLRRRIPRAGTYLLHVRGVDGDTGPYSLGVTVRGGDSDRGE